MDDAIEKLSELNTIATEEDLPRVPINADISNKINRQALLAFSEADINKAIKDKKKVFEKQLEVDNFAQSAMAQIAEKAIESKITKAQGEKVILDTLTKTEKEQVYFNRHKDTLAHYRVINPCSMLKMGLLVFIDILATIIAFPIFFIFRFITMLVLTFNGLAESVQKLIKTAFLLILIITGFVLLINFGILNFN